MSGMEKDAIERRDEAIALIEKHGQGDRFSERNWLMDQIVQILLGDEYQQWVEEYEKAGKPIPVRKWFVGTPPKLNDPVQSATGIQIGDIWVNNKTGKEVVIMETPTSRLMDVTLKHDSGRITEKKQHYFLYDYTKKGESDDDNA